MSNINPVHLTLWGPSAAGKTVLLAQLYIEAEAGGDWDVFPTAESHAFIRQMRASMASTNAFPQATPVGAVERIAYRFHHRPTGTDVVLEMEDRAGRDYEELEEESQTRLAKSSGLVLLFDPSRSPADLEREVWDTLESIHISSGRGARKDPRPIAVCLSKADLLLDGPADLERALTDPDGFVRDRVDPSLLKALDRFCEHYRLFPVSSAGVRLGWGVIEPVVFYDEDLNPRLSTDGGQPINVMAPFAWVLKQVVLKQVVLEEVMSLDNTKGEL